MNKRAVVALAIGGALFLIFLILFVILLVPSNTSTKQVAASDVLVEQALNGDSIPSKEQAAADLARSTAPDALDGLRSVLEKSKDAEVMTLVIQGIGEYEDRESLPRLITIVKDEKVVDDDNKAKNVRGSAAMAIKKIIGQDYRWNVEKEQTAEELEKFDKMVAAAEFFVSHPPPERPKKKQQ